MFNAEMGNCIASFLFHFFPYACRSCFCFFFNATATTEIYTLSLHDALPISGRAEDQHAGPRMPGDQAAGQHDAGVHRALGADQDDVGPLAWVPLQQVLAADHGVHPVDPGHYRHELCQAFTDSTSLVTDEHAGHGHPPQPTPGPRPSPPVMKTRSCRM